MVVVWKHGTRVLTAGLMVIKQDSRILLDNTSLTVRNLTTQDAGVYTCEVTIKYLVIQDFLKGLFTNSEYTRHETFFTKSSP